MARRPESEEEARRGLSFPFLPSLSHSSAPSFDLTDERDRDRERERNKGRVWLELHGIFFIFDH